MPNQISSQIWKEASQEIAIAFIREHEREGDGEDLSACVHVQMETVPQNKIK